MGSAAQCERPPSLRLTRLSLQVLVALLLAFSVPCTLGALTLTSCVPLSSPASGGTRIQCVGSGFQNASASGADRTKCSFLFSNNTQGQQYLSETFDVKSRTSIDCVVPDVSSAGLSPYGLLTVRVSGAGVNSDSLNFTVYDLAQIEIEQVSPSELDFNQSTVVLVRGRNYPDTGEIVCRVDNVSLPARYLNTTHVECTVPSVKASYMTRVDIWLNGDRTGYIYNRDVAATEFIYYYTAPSVTAIRFLDSYAALEVVLDRPAEIGGQVETQTSAALNVSCESFLSLPSLAKIGAGSRCRWSSQEQIALHVFLPASTKVSVGDSIDVAPSSSGSIGLRTRYQLFSRLTASTHLVQQALGHAPPTPVVILTGTVAVPACGSNVVSAHLSTGGGGRDLAFSWLATALSVTSEGLAQVIPLSSSTNSSFSIDHAWTSVAANPTVRVIVTARNFAGASAELPFFDVPVSGSPEQPTVFVLPPRFHADNFAFLESRLGRQECRMQSTYMSAAWTSTQAAFRDRLAPGNGTTAFVDTAGIAASVSTSGYPVSMTASAHFQRGTSANASSTVAVSGGVTFSPAAIQALLGGGSRRVVGATSSFALDACTSLDSDQRDSQLASIVWSCTTQESGAACVDEKTGGSLSMPPNTCTVGISNGQLASNRTHTFAATVSKPGRATDRVATSSVFVVAGDAPLVEVAAPLYTRHRFAGSSIALEGYVRSATPVKAMWRCVANITGFGYIDVQDPAVLSSQSSYSLDAQHSSSSSPDTTVSSTASDTYARKVSLVLRPGVLTPGLEYQFRLQAGSGSADMIISSGSPPLGGRIEIASGNSMPVVALTDTVSLVTMGWSDSPGVALRYRFGFQSSSGDIIWWTPLQGFGDLSCVMPYLDANAATNEITIWVEAQNNFGISAYSSTRLTVARSTSAILSLLTPTLARASGLLNQLLDWPHALANARSILASIPAGSVVSGSDREALLSIFLTAAEDHLPALKPYDIYLVQLLNGALALGVVSESSRDRVLAHLDATVQRVLAPSWLSPPAVDARRLRNNFALPEYRTLAQDEANAVLEAYVRATKSLESFPVAAQPPNHQLTFFVSLAAAIAKRLAIHQYPVALSATAAAMRVAVTTPPTDTYSAVSRGFGWPAAVSFPVAVATAFENYICSSGRCHGVTVVTTQFRSSILQRPSTYGSPPRSDLVLLSLLQPGSTASAVSVPINVTIAISTTSALSSASGRVQCLTYREGSGSWSPDLCTTAEVNRSIAQGESGKQWRCQCQIGPSGRIVLGVFERCPDGRYGDACSTPCPANKLYGAECTQTCACVNGDCDAATGQCSCQAGWQGATCAEPCSTGVYGVQCASSCQCQNGAHCNHINGVCTCTAGWRGSHCDETCDEQSFGLGCASRCTCQNGASCNHITGACTCAAGYRGTTCSEECTNSTYGLACSQSCTCVDAGTSLCHHANGSCTCQNGYTGVTCSVPPPVAEPASLAWVAAVVVVLLLIIAAIVIIVLWKKKQRGKVGIMNDNDENPGATTQRFFLFRLFQKTGAHAAGDMEEDDRMSGVESDIEMTRTVSRHEVIRVVGEAPAAKPLSDDLASPGDNESAPLLELDAADAKQTGLPTSDARRGQPVATSEEERLAEKTALYSEVSEKPDGGSGGDRGKGQQQDDADTRDGRSSVDDSSANDGTSVDDKSDDPDFCICGKQGEFECECMRQAYCSTECQQEDWDRHIQFCPLVESEVEDEEGEEEEEEEEKEVDGGGGGAKDGDDAEDDPGSNRAPSVAESDDDEEGEDAFEPEPPSHHDNTAAGKEQLVNMSVPKVKVMRRTMSEAPPPPTNMTLFVDRKSSRRGETSTPKSSAHSITAWAEAEQTKSTASIASKKSTGADQPVANDGLKPDQAPTPLFSRSFHAISGEDIAGKAPASPETGVDIVEDFDEADDSALV
eukprot:scpid12190/ scgid23144/ Multiple epidermal growth factor-like domains protein 10